MVPQLILGMPLHVHREMSPLEDCGSANSLSCTGENVSIPSGSSSELFLGLGQVVSWAICFSSKLLLLFYRSCPVILQRANHYKVEEDFGE